MGFPWLKGRVNGDTLSPASGIVAKPAAESGELPRLWTEEDDSENTDVSRATELLPLAKRSVARPRLRIMSGARAGEVIGLEDTCTLGRGREADIPLNEVGVSRLHCRFVRRGEDYVVEDLGSTNGTVVNGNAVTTWTLHAGDRIQVGEQTVFQFMLLDEAEDQLAQQLYEMSTRDPLTKAHNRRYFSDRFAAELSHARRHKSSVTVMLLDLDHFKSVNDEYGHAGGDALLKAVVQEISGVIRTEDLLARHGGEEFALLVRGTVISAVPLAERIRERIEALRLVHNGKVIRATISIGLAEACECEDLSEETVIGRADRRLYQAKADGRNRVVCSD